MIFDKVFLIGFNKTATRTITKFFKINGYKTQHDSKNWDLENYDFFSDLMFPCDFKNIYSKYPNSIFILNTRNLYDWIKSRCKHCIYYKRNWGYPLTFETCENWIDMRTNYYYEILNFFIDKNEKLILLNIDKKNWEYFLLEIFNLDKIFENYYLGKLNDDNYCIEIEQINKIILGVFEKKKLNINDKIYLIEYINDSNEYLKLYINNF